MTRENAARDYPEFRSVGSTPFYSLRRGEIGPGRYLIGSFEIQFL